MHVPKHYAVHDRKTLEAFIRDNLFGLLITHGEGGLLAEHIPFIWNETELIGHVNAKNPVVDRFGGAGLAVFSGPHAYISPRWYVSGMIIPTWNYSAVHVSGQLRRLTEEENYASLNRLVSSYEDLSSPTFSGMFERTDIENVSRGTTGFALSLDEILGQFKMSQNRTDEDYKGAVAGLLATQNPGNLAVATLMQELRPL